LHGLVEDLAARRRDDRGGRGGPGVAARAAVDVDGDLQRLLDGIDAREVARHARPATVALLAPRHALLLRARLTVTAILARAPLGRAPVDDDLHVGVVVVVLGELGIELVRQFLWHYAVDHRSATLSGCGNQLAALG